ncbi:4Fe-4S binding protein [Candidatus Bipolaricaulota bacterium]|nr:4Fe-4S binding protein [Candidatus Bipolaricaulota bacterium]
MTTRTKDEAKTKKWETDEGELYIKEDYCKGCGYCIEFCPQDVLEESEEFNEKGYHPPVPHNLEECVNCNFCGMICPDFAIWSEEGDKNE